MGNLAGEKYIQELADYWQVITPEPLQNISGNPKLVKDIETSLIGEYFLIDVPRKSTLLEQARIYNKRQSSLSGYLVKCISAYHSK